MAAGEPTLSGAVLRSLVVVAAFVGGVTFFAAPKTRAPPSTSTSSSAPAPSTDCDVGQRECRFAFDTHHAITLSLSPRPVLPARPLVVDARFDGTASNPRVTFTGAAMSMPVTTLPLSPRGHGAFVARGALPVCTEATMRWTARVDVELDGEPHSAVFAFVTRRDAAFVDGGVGGDAGDGGVVVDGGTGEDVELLPAGAPLDATLASGPGAAPLSLSSLRGKVVLVAFGFTSCPDVCPTTLSSWTAALNSLSPAERARVRGLFVSVDPARDTPAHVAQYAAYFHPNLVGATGSRAQIDAVTKTFGAFYEVHAKEGADAGADYAVDHAVFTWVVDPEGRIVARLPHAASVDVAVAAIRRFLPPRDP
jgi:protein SCO1/2